MPLYLKKRGLSMKRPMKRHLSYFKTVCDIERFIPLKFNADMYMSQVAADIGWWDRLKHELRVGGAGF